MRTAQIYFKYVDWIGAGECTRLQAAEHFKVHKSTAQYHLERAVADGYLIRVYSWTGGNQTGWGYQQPSRQSELPFEYESYPNEGGDTNDWYGEEARIMERAEFDFDFETPRL